MFLLLLVLVVSAGSFGRVWAFSEDADCMPRYCNWEHEIRPGYDAWMVCKSFNSFADVQFNCTLHQPTNKWHDFYLVFKPNERIIMDDSLKINIQNIKNISAENGDVFEFRFINLKGK